MLCHIVTFHRKRKKLFEVTKQQHNNKKTEEKNHKTSITQIVLLELLVN